MPRVAIRFAYDGTRFDSFARQPNRRTVERELLQSLSDAGVIVGASEARYGVASRTDRGVSAWGNICAVDTHVDSRAIIPRVEVPPGLWLLGATLVPHEFSPRRHALERTYRYHIVDPTDLDWKDLRAAARLFVGRHDFQKFCRREPGVTTVRSIRRVHVARSSREAYVQFRAPNYLWEQVRRLMHAMLSVARGERHVADLERQLRGEGPSEPPAAPEPLVLESVEVPVDFAPPPKKLVKRLRSSRHQASAAARFYEGLASSLPTVRR